MLKFAVTRKSLPPNYLSKTNKMDLRTFDINKIAAMVHKKTEQFKTTDSAESDMRTAVKRKAASDPHSGESKKTSTEPAARTLKRSVTVQMKVWSSQLTRIKKRTESLRKRDQEIKERFEKIQRRAKRIFSAVDQSKTDDIYETSPPKRARLLSGDSILYHGNDCVLLQRLDDKPRKTLTPIRRHKSGSDIPSRASFDDLLGRSPVPYPRTFMKNGLKCTNC